MKYKLSQALGILIIGWLVYRTILMTRQPYKLDGTVGWYMYTILVIIALTQLIIMYILIKEWRKVTKKITLLVRTVTWLVEELYNKPLQYIGERLLKRERIRKVILYWSQVLLAIANTKWKVIIMTFIFQVNPKVLILLGLLGDVILLSEIKVFYTVICYGIIPLAYMGVIGLIKMEGQRGMDKLLSKEIAVEEDTKEIRITPLSTRMDMTQDILEKHKQKWIELTNILDIVKAISLIRKERIYLGPMIIITLLFLLSWTISIHKITVGYLRIYVDNLPDSVYRILMLFLIGI